MPELKDRLKVEFENIEKCLKEIPKTKSCSELSLIELAGVSTLLHNFYSGVEKILKDILTSQNVALPEGASWHKDLVQLAVENKIILQETSQMLNPYLAFRHFFAHAYVIHFDAEQIEPLVQEVETVFKQFKKDLTNVKQLPV